jgi:DNA-binding SARP family transcriptional activator
MYMGADEAVYAVLEKFDSLMTDGKFEEVEKILNSVIVEDAKDEVLVAYVMAGRWAQDKYKETYRSFYDKVYAHFGEDAEDILHGLAPKE